MQANRSLSTLNFGAYCLTDGAVFTRFQVFFNRQISAPISTSIKF